MNKEKLQKKFLGKVIKRSESRMPKMLSKMFNPDRYEKAEFTGLSQKLKTVTASELKSEKATTWVDKKLINLFMDRWSDIGIYIKDPREPVIL